MKICLGGTFYPLHEGHRELLRKAFQVAGPNGTVFIGLTSQTMIKKKGKIAPYQQRKQSLMHFFSELHVLQQATIRPILNKYGPTIKGDFDAIIVSPETKPTAEEINRRRRAFGKTPLQIIVIPYVLSEDGIPISSSRIRRKEIDENGTILKQE
jgi:pantetheine-phosphate adenylyltransferase